MFIANKIINTTDKVFHKGDVIPEEFVSDHLKQIGAVLFKADPKVEKKLVKVKDVKPTPIKPHVDEKPAETEILTEDSSKVEVTKE